MGEISQQRTKKLISSPHLPARPSPLVKQFNLSLSGRIIALNYFNLNCFPFIVSPFPLSVRSPFAVLLASASAAKTFLFLIVNCFQ
jgi:hypothetical protein